MSTAFKGLTITVGADTKQFNKEMKAVDRSIRDTNRQVTELQKGLELEFDAGRFSEAQRLAQKAIEQTEQKAQALKEQLRYLESTGADTNASSYQKLKTELVKAENQAVLLKNKLEEIKQMKLDKLAKQFEDVGGGITKAGQALAPFSAAAAGALAGLGAIGKSTIEYADNLKTFADRVNLSAEELQKWQYIAMQTDVTNEELQAGLVKAQGAFGSLAKGDIDVMSQALKDLGFSAEEAVQGMGPNFDELVQRLAAIEDPMLQAAYANEIFGERMGAKLIPMLKAGGEGLAELGAEFENFGTLTEEQINSLAEFDNVINKIKYSFKTIKDQIGIALLPVMQSLADFINAKVIPAVQKLTDWFTGLSDGQKNALVGTLAFVAALAPVLMVVGKLTTGIGSMIKAVGGLGKALTFLSAHPIIAVIGIIVALLVTLYSTNEQFRNSINNLVQTLGAALMPVLDTLGNLLTKLVTSLMPLLDMLAEALVPIIDTLATALVPIIELLADALVPIIDMLAEALVPIIDTLVAVLIPILKVLTPIFEKIIQIQAKMAQVMLSILGPAIKKLGSIFSAVFGAIPGIIEGVIKFVEKAVNRVIDFINGIIRQINKLSDIIGFTLQELNNVEFNMNIGATGIPDLEEPTTESPTTPDTADTIAQTPTSQTPTYTTNNDYSNKDVVINVTVENYAENVDVDDLVRQVNLKLAESL